MTSKIRVRDRWHTGPGSPRRAPTTTSWMQHLKKPLLSLLQVTVEDGMVFITAKKKVLTLPAVPEHRQHLRLRVTSAFCTLLQDLESSLRVKDTSRRCLLNKNTMLLLGGGQ